MFFEEINNKLLAVAKKGTREDYFSPMAEVTLHSKRKTAQRKQRYSAKSTLSKQNRSQRTEEIIKAQAIAQLTLFDLP